MAEKYIDPLATGANDGSSKTDAWESLQEAIDDATGGAITSADTVLIRHTNSPDEQPTTAVNVDNATGTGSVNAAVPTYIGVNTSWVEDGTEYELDFQNATATNGLDFTSSSVDYTVWKHLEIYNADLDGINQVSGSLGHCFIDCISRNNGQIGFSLSSNTNGKLFGCLAYGNGSEGFNSTNNQYWFCCSRDNTEEGFVVTGLFYGCLSFDNGKYAYSSVGDNTPIVINSVFDGKAASGFDCMNIAGSRGVFLGNRITNAPTGQYGITGVNERNFFGYNYFQDNAGGNINPAIDDYYIEAFNLLSSATTNQFDQGDTDAGYKSLVEGSENYELETDATLFEAAIQIPTGQ